MLPVFCCVQCPVADASSVPLAWLAMSIASTTAAPTSHSPACDPDLGTRGGESLPGTDVRFLLRAVKNICT